MRPLLGLVLASLALWAQKPFEFWPDSVYDRKIPASRDVLGYEPGDHITPHAGIVRYMEALAAAAPARMKLFEYGQSWEGRKLIYAAIGSEANIRRLSEIRAAMTRLADPRKTSDAEARKLMADLPAVVWLSYGVHGNEISSPDAALLTAYHLLAARSNKMVDDILSHVVVLIDPLQNPDGRDRFVHYFESARGIEPDPNPSAAEHHEPWPAGRANHYLFDLNRDWIGLTQPEIRSQVKTLREWFPLVYVDLHEMSGESTYFFSPESDPYNPHLTESQRESLKLFGRNNARWFDRYGFDYFTRENYDAFYPGYGASWPMYYGAIAMTYEQASVRGLALRRSDGAVLTFRETVRHHFVASLATLETAAANREKLLADFYHYRATAIDEGRKEPVVEYLLPRGRDASATDKLAGVLMEHGIEVERARAPFRTEDREWPAGTYRVSMAQPSKRLIRTLLDPHIPMDTQFVEAEEARRRVRQRSEIYDVTAWSLPLLFNVEAVATRVASQGRFEPAPPGRVHSGEMHGSGAKVAYLAEWGSEAAGRLLTAALRLDLKVHSSERAFTLNGTRFPAGSLIFKVAGNPPGLESRLAALARETGADLYATDTGWVEDGVNFGSHYVVPVKKPAVAMAWDSPVSSGSAGAARFVLERQYGFPVTAIRTSELNTPELSRFDVLILPDGGAYSEWMGEGGVRRLKEWVQAGGTVIALGGAVNFLAEKEVALLDTAQENAVQQEERKPAPAEAGRVPGTEISSAADYDKVIHAATSLPDSAPGAIAKARVQPGHWLTAGAGDSVYLVVEGRAIYTPLKVDKGVNAVYFESADQVLASGYLWNENRKQMAFKPVVAAQTSGRGVAVAFTADPNFRGIQDGMNVLFLNAVFRGPSHAR